jgi:hypothetical protein
VAEPQVPHEPELLQSHVDVLEVALAVAGVGEVVLGLEEGPLVDGALEEDPRAAELGAAPVLRVDSQRLQVRREAVVQPHQGRVAHDPAAEVELEGPVVALELVGVAPLEGPVGRALRDRRCRLVDSLGDCRGRRDLLLARLLEQVVVLTGADLPGVQHDVEQLLDDGLVAPDRHRLAADVIGPGGLFPCHPPGDDDGRHQNRLRFHVCSLSSLGHPPEPRRSLPDGAIA